MKINFFCFVTMCFFFINFRYTLYKNSINNKYLNIFKCQERTSKDTKGILLNNNQVQVHRLFLQSLHISLVHLEIHLLL